jgi:hypothetical protein
MFSFERRSEISAPVEELFAWHTRPRAFERLIPPWEKIKVLEKQGAITDGSRLVLEVQLGLFQSRRWVAVHSDYIEGQQFRDTQVEGPFAKWIHTHRFFPDTNETSQLGDLGDIVAGGFVADRMKKYFYFRHTRTQNDLKRIVPFAGRGSLRILISGASGMIGTSLLHFLSAAGHEVYTLTRKVPGENEIFWDPIQTKIDRSSLENMDAVIHLAGENIGAGRWTVDRKKLIRESRSVGTRFLAETLASLNNPPKVFLSSSAIGFYGDRGEEALNEQSAAGHGFLPGVCEEWEKATEPAQKAGIRVVNIRTGIVLSANGGALPKMVLPIRLGAGGIIGGGKQWMSWIALEDLIGIFHYAIHHPELSGPVNATAPGALTNRDFTRVLGKILSRPTLFPLPGFMVKILFGEMGQALLLEGQRVKPTKLTEAGFEFLYPYLESALQWELGRFP